MGHPNVCVLDGGFPKWVKESRPVECTSTSDDGFGYKLNVDKIKHYDHMKTFAEQKHFTVLDARAPDQYAAGHIDGAISFPVGKIMNMDSKTMKSADDRKAAFEAAGVDLGGEITVHCMSGVAATVLFASLSDIATG